MTVLAIETSCDETAAAVMRDDALLSSEVASQIALHALTGGVVPEVASRNHLRTLRPVIEAALQKAGVTLGEIDIFAATRGPGLATSLMIGLSAAKGMAIGFQRPFAAVNHIEAHLLSPFFGRGGVRPSVGLVVSGGHTMLVEIEGVGKYRLLGKTQDDAAGEAFDKVGKLLGLPYPGGPNVNRLANEGDAKRFDFPRSMLSSGDFAFSFSGLKTSVRYMLQKMDDVPVADVCASFQEAVVDVLVDKTVRAALTTRRKIVAVSGGVSCNTRLREKLAAACSARRIELLLAEPSLCTDNAAMIAYVASLRIAEAHGSDLAEDIDPNLRLTV
ncbi:MAG: tRNA (adenosine(37)-N6)-threonylcarbamoyltransferase complex transferase subunit TsaD [Chthoniobacteraceae bacterium]